MFKNMLYNYNINTINVVKIGLLHKGGPVMKKNIKWLYSELEVLIQKGVMTEEAAKKIKAYYDSSPQKESNNLFLVFAILGVVFTGLGVISLFAYNWDQLSRGARTVISILPLLISQGIALFSVHKNKSAVWKEASGLAVGISILAAISLIGQTYNLPGDFGDFMMVCLLLVLPIIYLMNLNYLSLFYLFGTIVWAGYEQNIGGSTIPFWWLGLMLIPHYYFKLRKNRFSIESVLLSWGIGIWLLVSTGIVLEKVIPGLWIVIYSCLIWTFYRVGKQNGAVKEVAILQNPYYLFGVFGTIVLGYLFSFKWPWLEIGLKYYRSGWEYNKTLAVIDYLILAVLIIVTAYYIYKTVRNKEKEQFIFASLPVITTAVYLIVSAITDKEIANLIPIFIFNAYLLVFSIRYIYYGIQYQQANKATVGLLTIAILIFTRFIDSDIGFVGKGIAFIIIGIGFLTSNIWVSNRMKVRGDRYEDKS